MAKPNYKEQYEKLSNRKLLELKDKIDSIDPDARQALLDVIEAKKLDKKETKAKTKRGFGVDKIIFLALVAWALWFGYNQLFTGDWFPF